MPYILEARDHVQHAYSSVSGMFGKVGSGKKRFFVRCHDNGQWPAATAGHHGTDGHVNGINIGPLFAIHLDTDKGVIEQSGNRFIFKRFPLHDMAPVTGGIADG